MQRIPPNPPKGGRITSIDLARGFTVFIMPGTHALMMYGQPILHHTLLVDIFRFLAEGPGGQLFMLLMGVSFTFSRRITRHYVFQRVFILFAAGYLLNIFKFIVPLGLGLIPENLLAELQLSNDISAVKFFFFMGDILHFAAIAYLILYLVSRFQHYAYWSLLLAIAIMIISPLVWDVKTGLVFVDQLFVLFNGHPPYTFFPIFPWLVYPLTGLTIGYFLKHYNADHIIRKAGLTGIGLIILSLGFPSTKTITEWPSFYRTEAPDTLFHIGFVLTWLAIIHWISKKGRLNFFSKLLTFCSRHITSIYIIQWILICWCMALTGYMQLKLGPVVVWMCGVTVITLLLTHAITSTNVKKDI